MCIRDRYTAVEIAAPDVADAEVQRKTLPADPTVKNFSYTVVDGEIYYRENSIDVYKRQVHYRERLCRSRNHYNFGV